MLLKKLVAFFILSVLSPVFLIALPQDLEIFTDFENVSGEGTIFIGVEPNVVTLIGFTVETLEDPAQLHSGTKALTLGPGQEGQIISSRGLQFLQLYAGETTGAGKIEVRGIKNVGSSQGSDRHIELVLGGVDANAIIEGLPANISPDANPTLYSWVGDSGNFFDITDLDFHSGIQNVKFFNVTGKLVIDDLGFTLTDFPSNNTVYETFSAFGSGHGEFEPIILGTPPNTASIEGGSVLSEFSRTGCPPDQHLLDMEYLMVRKQRSHLKLRLIKLICSQHRVHHQKMEFYPMALLMSMIQTTTYSLRLII